MTDNEIIRALENYPMKTHALFEAINLINRQKAEIARLTYDNNKAIEEALSEGYRIGREDERRNVGRHGKWFDFHVTVNGIAEELCSRCEVWTIGRNKTFCPNCGAKMDGESNGGK